MNLESRSRVKLLVDALRGGEFQQGQGNLRHGDSYCCLGVACEVYSRKTGEGTWRPVTDSPHTAYDFVIGSAVRSGYLPNQVDAWYGFGNSNPNLYDADGKYTTATQMNDVFNLSLSAIADAFERTYLTNATKPEAE